MRPWISLDHLSQRGLRVVACVKFGPTKMFCFFWFVPNLAINVYSITATIKHQDNIVLGCFGVHGRLFSGDATQVTPEAVPDFQYFMPCL